MGRVETGTKQVVYHRFEGIPTLPHFLLEPDRDVRIQRESGSHIVMMTC
jgi:hypothetical protein